MVDYQKQLGSQAGSLMMIRDLGQTVEFWVISGSPYTYTAAMPFGWTVNGSTGSGTITYPAGGNWLKVKSFTVQTSQTVTFRIGATGTTGLNGPSEFKKYIERATVRVRHNGSWKYAIPYVKHGGKWKVAQAWIRSGGKWKVGG